MSSVKDRSPTLNPRYVRFTDSFPMTVTGKIQKYKMREMAMQELRLETDAGVAAH